MNKKGFTLIELLAVITLIAIIAVIAIPNVVKMVDGSKREMFVNDAKDMISKAKYMYKLDKYSGLFDNDGTTCKTITLAKLALDIEKDPDGLYYNPGKTIVKVCLGNNTNIFSVKTESGQKTEEGTIATTEGARKIYNSNAEDGYVIEKDLNKESVID